MIILSSFIQIGTFQKYIQRLYTLKDNTKKKGEITMIENTLFPVKEYPANFAYNSEAGISDVKENTGYKFIVREDTGSVVSCMTNNYRLVTNQEVSDASLPVIKKWNGVLTEANTFANGARTKWTYKLPDQEVDIGNGDVLNPQVSIHNSYDGSAQVSVLAGTYRLVCSNGMTIGRISDHKKFKHIIWNETDLSNLENIIEQVVDNIPKVFASDMPVLTNTKIDGAHIKDVIEMFPNNHGESITNYIIAKQPKNYWDLLNVATWASTHLLNRKTETTHKLEDKIYPKVMRMAKVAQA